MSRLIENRIENLSPEQLAILSKKLKKVSGDKGKKISIQKRNNSEDYPMSSAQKRLWFLNQLDPESVNYNIFSALKLEGTLSVEALNYALNEIISRHEIMRSIYNTKGNEPVQVILPSVFITLELTDLSNLEKSIKESEIHKYISEEAKKPFDLKNGPLIRGSVIKISEKEHVLLLTIHHIIADGWSFKVLINELAIFYKAFVSHTLPIINTLPIQYPDFAAWQNDYIQSEAVQKQLSYWEEKLQEMPQSLDLPLDNHRPSIKTFQGARCYFEIAKELKESLLKLCHEQSATLYMVLLASFQVFLYRITGQKDFGIGVPIANRNRPEIENLIGFFVNTMVIRVDIKNDSSFRDVIKNVRKSTTEAYDNQDLPFDKVVEVAQVSRDISSSPLFQVMFDLQDLPLKQLLVDDLSFSVIDIDNKTSKLDLVLLLEDDGLTIKGIFEYDTSIFRKSTIEKMMGIYKILLKNLALMPDSPISILSVMTEEEKNKILYTYNDTKRSYPRDMLVHHVFEKVAALYPNRIAVEEYDNKYTYSQLHVRSNKLARYIQKYGAGINVPVVVFMERSFDMIAAIMAILKAGSAYVPIDTSFPKARIKVMLEDIASPVILTKSSLVDLLPETKSQILEIDKVQNEIELEKQDSPENTTVGISSGVSLAYVIYTSGSTGVPKGVAVTHRGICRLVLNTNYVELFPEDRILHTSNVTFDAATFEIWGALLNGASLVILSKDDVLSTQKYLGFIRQNNITCIFTTTALFNHIVNENADAFSTVKNVFFGGECADVKSVWKVLNGKRPQRLTNVYGPTECTTYSTVYLIESLDEKANNVPIGPPIANSTAYVLDQNLQLVPQGFFGELYVGGDGLADRYISRADLTAEKFIPDPFSREKGARLYRTGDLVRLLPDGNYEFKGRIDNQIKLRGFRIELGEIESDLKKHHSVNDSIVLLREDIPGDKKITAYIQSNDCSIVSSAELKSYLSEKLPEYMVPTHFIIMEKFPTNVTGKIDRNALQKLQINQQEDSKSYVAPRTKLEIFLADIWEEVLGIKNIGIYDNFFELGGNSIKAAVLINRLQKEFNEEAHVKAIFVAPTIAELALYINEYYPDLTKKIFGEESAEVYNNGEAGFNKTIIEENEFRKINIEDLEELKSIISVSSGPEKITGKKNPKAIFVLSPPRSGSTLLRVMLAGNPKLFSPPELELLSFNSLGERRDILNGQYDLWLEATIRAIMEIKGCCSDEAERIMHELEDANLSVKEFYGMLQNWIGEKVLIDKTPAYSFNRRILERAEEYFENPLYIHLVRHPYATIYSFVEAKLDKEFFRYSNRFNSRELAELIWILSHQNINDFLEGIPEIRKHQLRFEDLIQNPQNELEKICSFIGVEFHPDMLKPYEGRKMTDPARKNSLMVGDYKFYLRNKIDTNTIGRWKKFHFQEFLSDNAWDIAEKYGYKKEFKDNGKNGEDKQRKHLTEIQKISREGELALSFAQQRLWFLDQLDPNNPFYNISSSVKLIGDFNETALKKSLNEIVKRHEILRTTFPSSDGKPKLKINHTINYDYNSLDFSSFDGTEREGKISELINEESRRSFDIANGPLFRVLLIRENDKTYILVITMHHIISDGWSMSVLFNEITFYYHTFNAEEYISLPELPIQYLDYAYWQREYLKGDKFKQQSDYWLKRLDDIPQLINLPLDYPRPAIQSHSGDRVSYEIIDENYKKVVDLCNKHNVTPFMVFVAAAQILLHKYSGQKDICLGTPIAGRSIKELEPLIGFFANTVVLRGNIEENSSFSEYLKNTYTLTVEALSNQDLPFEKLVDLLQPERDMSYTPLFQVMLSYNRTPLQGNKLDSLEIVPVKIVSKISKFDLLIEITEMDDAFKIEYEYNTDLFRESTIRRMAEHMANLLSVIIQSPERKISELPILSKDEYEKIMYEWNRESKRNYVVDQTFYSLFEEQVKKYPDVCAVEYEDRAITYNELNRRANQLARYLRKKGAGPEKFVVVCMNRSIELITSIVGILKAGGAYVPLDPSYPKERIRTVVKEIPEALVVTVEELSGLFAEKCEDDIIKIDKDYVKIVSEPDENIQNNIPRECPAYMIFTSGSTGIPKGVIIQHDSLINLFVSLKEKIYSGYNKKMRISLNAPAFFDASLQQIVMLLDGHTLVIIPQEIRGSGTDFREYIGKKRIEVLDCVPSQLKMLIEAGIFEEGKFKPLICLPGGEAIENKVWKKLQSQAEVEVFNMYGPTECTVDSIICHINKSHEVPNIGRPVFNTEVYILDRYMNPVPIGVRGEIYLGGAALGRGYYNHPDITADKYLPNPFGSNGERIYRTGDLGRFMEDGTVEYSGRTDHQVKIRGFRIETTEIENSLKNHPHINEALVETFEDKSDNRRLLAYICFREKDHKGSVSDLREFLKNRLPDYMIPSIFIFLEEMPVTLNGKIDRKKLPKADEKRPELSEEYQKPENEIEIKLTEIWKQVLQINEVGVNDNFFELGGDSIMSIQVIAKANQSGIKLSSKHMFLHPTIRGLASVASDAIPKSAEQALIKGEVMLSPIQRRFFENNFKVNDHWHQINLFRIEEKLDSLMLEKAFDEIVRHHDILRANFYTEEKEIKQVISEVSTGKSFYHISMTESPGSNVKDFETVRNNWLIKQINEIQNSFKLNEGSLIKLACIEDGQNSYIFISAHHLIIDSVSWRILLDDLWTIYKQLKNGQNPILPLKTTSYKSWVDKIEVAAHSEEITRQVDFWISNTPKESVNIPVDFKIPLIENLEQSVEMGTVSMSSEDTDLMLHRLPSKYDIRINELLIASLYKTIVEWSNDDEIYVDVENHGREELFADVDLSRTVGWFTSIYPLFMNSHTLKLINPKEVSKNNYTRVIEAIKIHMRNVAERGMNFGLLKYMNEQTSDKMKEIPSPQISFNYLGQFYQNQIPELKIFSSIQPEERHPVNQRPYLLDFTASVINEKLIMGIRYSKIIHSKETISSLANSYTENLHEIIHCLLEAGNAKPENISNQDYGLDQDQYKNLLDELNEE